MLAVFCHGLTAVNVHSFRLAGDHGIQGFIIQITLSYDPALIGTQAVQYSIAELNAEFQGLNLFGDFYGFIDQFLTNSIFTMERYCFCWTVKVLVLDVFIHGGRAKSFGFYPWKVSEATTIINQDYITVIMRFINLDDENSSFQYTITWLVNYSDSYYSIEQNENGYSKKIDGIDVYYSNNINTSSCSWIRNISIHVITARYISDEIESVVDLLVRSSK